MSSVISEITFPSKYTINIKKSKFKISFLKFNFLELKYTIVEKKIYFSKDRI